MIHRWFTERGLPGDEDKAHIKELTQLANTVELEANIITKGLTGYMLKANDSESPSKHIIGLFKKLNIDEI